MKGGGGEEKERKREREGGMGRGVGGEKGGSPVWKETLRCNGATATCSSVLGQSFLEQRPGESLILSIYTPTVHSRLS